MAHFDHSVESNAITGCPRLEGYPENFVCYFQFPTKVKIGYWLFNPYRALCKEEKEIEDREPIAIYPEIEETSDQPLTYMPLSTIIYFTLKPMPTLNLCRELKMTYITYEVFGVSIEFGTPCIGQI